MKIGRKRGERGVEINVATIIIVILALLVLVILALYFTGGMKALWQRISGVGGAYEESDVTTARQLCETFCASNNIQEFCVYTFTLRKKDGGTETKHCNEAPINAQKTETCKNLDIDCSEYEAGEGTEGMEGTEEA